MKETPLSIQMEKHDHLTEVVVAGSVDSQTCETFGRRLKPLEHRPDLHVLLDGRGLTYINSRGIGCLIALQKQLMIHGGRLALYGLSERIVTTLDLLGIEKRLHHFPDREAAVAYLNQDPEPHPHA